MKIHNDLQHLGQLNHSVVTIGAFDGVHLGHQKILKRVVDIASEVGGESVLVTFWPHPRMVLDSKNHSIKLLSSFREKINLIEKFGINHLISIPFTKGFSETSSEDFIQKILIEKLRTKKLVIGYDHRFGKGREGGFDYLKAHQHRFTFELEEISREDVDHIGISSTKIRHALELGDIQTANSFLGRPYELIGKVVKGNQLGRSIGFPTANILPEDPNKLVPKDGAYIVNTIIKGKLYEGMLNIGQRPTVNSLGKAIEVNVFNFSGDLYDHDIEILFHRFLREERKFENLEQLKSQLEVDKKRALNYFSQK